MGHFTHSGWIKFFIAILLQAIGLITLLLSTLIVSHLQICLVAPGGVTLIHMVLESLPYLQFKRDELRGVPVETEREENRAGLHI